jgi:hypothetical protein
MYLKRLFDFRNRWHVAAKLAGHQDDGGLSERVKEISHDVFSSQNW